MQRYCGHLLFADWMIAFRDRKGSTPGCVCLLERKALTLSVTQLKSLKWSTHMLHHAFRRTPDGVMPLCVHLTKFAHTRCYNIYYENVQEKKIINYP